MSTPLDAVRADHLFGKDVFSRKVMKQRLPKDVYKALLRTIDRGEKLKQDVADIVAAPMKDWAVERGATHFTHWFQPLTGLTAEKHDSLISPDGTESRMFEAHNRDANLNLSWTFSSVRHWGESAAGNWTVRVRDLVLAGMVT